MYSGLYFINRLVVGSSRLIERIRLLLLGASRLMPAWAKPMMLSNKVSSAWAWSVIVVLVVLAAFSTVRMFWAAAP